MNTGEVDSQEPSAQLVALQRDNDACKREVNQLKAQLAHSKAQAQAANVAKNHFLAAINHEIRTPMNAIIGMSHLALNSGLDSIQCGYVKKVHHAAQDLMRILDKVLDFKQLEASKVTLRKDSFRVNDVLSTFCDYFDYKAEEKGLALLLDMAPDLTDCLTGDQQHLVQILLLLGENAIKFTTHGKVVLGVRGLDRTDEAVTLHFWLADTGIGMTDGQQKALFQAFSHLEGADNRRFGGIGMGLAVAKRLADLMGGHFHIESELGQGTTFHFKVRFGIDLTPHSAIEPETAPSEEHILIVAESEVERDGLAQMGNSLGFKVDTSNSGIDAIRKVAQANRIGSPFSFVLIQSTMRAMDGIQTVKRMHQTMIDSTPAVVMVTAHGRSALLRDASAAEVSLQSILTQPVTPQKLLESIRIARGHAQTNKDMQHRKNDSLADICRKLHGARLLLVDDSILTQELASELLREQGIACEIANDGQEALDWLDRDSAFDGVLMDCQMPRMDGYTATQHIRSNPAFGRLPIIALTANALLGDKENALHAGMNAHIAKPINVMDMFTTLARWIKVRNPAPSRLLPRAKAPATHTNHALLPALPGIDIHKGLRVTNNCVQLYRRLLVRFQKDYANFSEDFQRARSDSDTSAAIRLVHTLKGSAGSIGATDVYACAVDLEISCFTPNQANHIPMRLEDLTAALQPVLEGLQEQLGKLAPSEAQRPPLQDAALAKLCLDLKAYLMDSDIEALPLAEQLVLALTHTQWVAEAKQINAHVEAFAFDAAMECMDELLPHIASTETNHFG
jgi:two-component system sensor histidine kinase/response regulator